MNVVVFWIPSNKFQVRLLVPMKITSHSNLILWVFISLNISTYQEVSDYMSKYNFILIDLYYALLLVNWVLLGNDTQFININFEIQPWLNIPAFSSIHHLLTVCLCFGYWYILLFECLKYGKENKVYNFFFKCYYYMISFSLLAVYASTSVK
jgi:hypothetical protein